MARVSANGLEIEILDQGPPDGAPILLIMGFACQLLHWQAPLVDGLIGRGFRVIRMDNRDAGLSSKLDHLGVPSPASMDDLAAPPYRIDDMAADAVGVLDALGISSAHIVGASMGGMIAQAFAGHYPQRVRSLISIMSSTGDPDLPQGREDVVAALMQPPPDPNDREACVEAHIRFWELIGSPAYGAGQAELRALAEAAIDRSLCPQGSARQIVAILASPPRGPLLQTVTAPTMVIHGDDDPLVPVEAGLRTASYVSHARMERIPGLGHDMTRANAPIYERLIGDFAANVEAARG